MSQKNYALTRGDCSGCCLLFNCSSNKENMKKFLMKLGLVCENGYCVEVVVVQPELGFEE